MPANTTPEHAQNDGVGYPPRPVILARADAVEQLSAVVTDIHLMHGIDGRSVLRELRRASPKLPAVVVTGFEKAAPEADLRGLGGPTARLVKPFGCDDLIASLAGVISSTNGRAPRANEAERAAHLRKTSNYVFG